MSQPVDPPVDARLRPLVTGLLTTWWPVALALSIFLLGRPYQGIVHDARLYVGFAVARLDPAGIGSDLLFVHDGQSGRSLYPALLRVLCQVFDPSTAALALTVLGLLVWFAGAWMLARRLWPSASREYLAAAVIISTTIQTSYGGSSVFHYAEAFAAPRAIAEGTSLLGLALVIRGSWAAGLTVQAIAMTLHPLMSVSVLLVSCCVAISNRRTLAILTGFSFAVAFALLVASWNDVAPDSFLRRFDAEWLSVLDEIGALVFMTHWDAIDWARICVHAVTVLMAMNMWERGSRAVVECALVVSLGCLLLGAIGGDLVKNVLVTQAQPWRALWLLTFCSGLSLTLLIKRHFVPPSDLNDSRECYRAVAVGLLLVSWFMVAISPAGATLSVLAALLWWVPVLRPTLRLWAVVPLCVMAVVPLLIVLIVAIEANVVFGFFAASPQREQLWHWPTFVLAGAMRLMGVLVALRLLRLVKAQEKADGLQARSGSKAAFVWTTGALVCALLVFDSRTRYQQKIEARLDGQVQPAHVSHTSSSSAALPTEVETVYWPDGDLEPWALLGRPGYGTELQGIPRVFDRTLALTWADRRKRIERIQEHSLGSNSKLSVDPLGSDDPSAIRQLCEGPNAPGSAVIFRKPRWANGARDIELPAPIVIPGKLPGQEWKVRSKAYLISCGRLRTELAALSPE